MLVDLLELGNTHTVEKMKNSRNSFLFSRLHLHVVFSGNRALE
jgi:hypothetical protein